MCSVLQVYVPKTQTYHRPLAGEMPGGMSLYPHWYQTPLVHFLVVFPPPQGILFAVSAVRLQADHSDVIRSLCDWVAEGGGVGCSDSTASISNMPLITSTFSPAVYVVLNLGSINDTTSANFSLW